MFEIHTSNRKALCRICNHEIKPGLKKVVANLGTGNFDGHYHIKCFIDRFEDTLRKLADELSEPITGSLRVEGRL